MWWWFGCLHLLCLLRPHTRLLRPCKAILLCYCTTDEVHLNCPRSRACISITGLLISQSWKCRNNDFVGFIGLSLHKQSRKRDFYCACANLCPLPAQQPIKAFSGSEDLFYSNFINHVLVKYETDRDLVFYKSPLWHFINLSSVVVEDIYYFCDNW